MKIDTIEIKNFKVLLHRYLQSFDIQCDTTNIKTFLDFEIDNLLETKKEFLDKSSKINEWIKSKKDKLPNRNIFSFDNNITLSEIKEFHLSKLNNKDLSTLATKDDIEKIISNIVKEYKIGLINE